jgi:hypothetical protein
MLYDLFLNERAPFTHPDYASLVESLFACGGKEGGSS